MAATITTTLGLPMWVDTLTEYVFGFAFGLLIFQALFMKDMLGGSYVRALRGSFMPEWLSMNTVMAGMIPTMVILMSRDMRAMEPISPRYRGVMALATLVGLIAAYPVNWWLVANGLKHGIGTTRALGKGGHSMATERARGAGPSGARDQGRHHGTGSRRHYARHGRAVTMEQTMGQDAAGGVANMDMTPKTTRPQLVAVTLLSVLALAGGTLLAALFGDFAMRAGAMSAIGGMTGVAAPMT